MLSSRASAAMTAADRAIQRFLRTGAAVRYKVMKNWGVIGGIAAALAAGIYVIWGPITERKKRRKGLVPGLVNLGNTCFMNSLLQGLSACPTFIKWLEEFTTQYTGGHKEPPQHQYLSLTLLHLLKALSCQEVTDEEVLDASCLLDVLRMYRWQISSFEEQVNTIFKTGFLGDSFPFMSWGLSSRNSCFAAAGGVNASLDLAVSGQACVDVSVTFQTA